MRRRQEDLSSCGRAHINFTNEESARISREGKRGDKAEVDAENVENWEEREEE